MGIDRQISSASKTLYLVAAAGLIHLLTSGLYPLTWVLGSGFVDVATAYAITGHEFLGVLFADSAIVAFAGLGFFAGRGAWWAMLAGAILVAGDAAMFFDRVTPGGPTSSGVGLLASFLIVSHAIMFWFLASGFLASVQRLSNRGSVRRLELEAELRRRLAESDDPPPPAASFDTRFRGIPPGGPSLPPQPQG